MKTEGAHESILKKPLRLWPGIALAVLVLLLRYVVPAINPEFAMQGVLSGLAGSLAIFIWWTFFSRAPWSDRLITLSVMIIAAVGTAFLLHESIATGMMGLMFPIYIAPLLGLALVVWATLSAQRSQTFRRYSMMATFLLLCGTWTLLRTDGISGSGSSDLEWRWSKTAEEKLLNQTETESSSLNDTKVNNTVLEEPIWPGFRGPERNSIVRNSQIETNWQAAPPQEMWRRSVGPGWSSFAVQGNLFYTQEQRGEEEVVSCYKLDTGEPVWKHATATRFWESNAGAGPRGTPTLHAGRVYTFGATGTLNVLDARNGSLIWTRNVASDTESKTPGWGFSSSPLIVGDIVAIASSGALAAYEMENGELRWFESLGGEGYSSPHLLTIDGVQQILQMSGAGLASISPSDGKVLWEHVWKGYPIVQPAIADGGEVLISTGDRSGVRRIHVSKSSDGWTAEERWTSNRLKPYFNDFVVHEGHAFGFDSGILACMDLKDGKRKWKGGRYGRGQLVLLADQGLLIVISEQGELALVEASSDGLNEISRLKALEGKTWNHPVLAGDTLLVRNDHEMAAFQLSIIDS